MVHDNPNKHAHIWQNLVIQNAGCVFRTWCFSSGALYQLWGVVYEWQQSVPVLWNATALPVCAKPSTVVPPQIFTIGGHLASGQRVWYC